MVVAASLALAFLSPLREWLTLDGLRAVSARVATSVQADPALWIVGFGIASVMATAASFPIGPVIGILGGALFGFWTGFAVVLVASTIGSTGAFLVTRNLLRPWVEAKMAKRLEPIDAGFRKRGAAYLLALRLNPFIPYWIVNLATGLTKIPLATFVPLSFIGLAPAISMYAYAGTRLATLSSPRELMSPALLVSLLLLSLFPLMLRLFDVRRGAATS